MVSPCPKWDGRREAQNVVEIFCVCKFYTGLISLFGVFWRHGVSFFGVEVGKPLILFSGATFHQIEVADCPKRRSAAMPFRAGQRSEVIGLASKEGGRHR